MSQESSSTQLCEVLIDCYQDKEKKKHDQNSPDQPGKSTRYNESDEDPLQKHLNAPFTLLRRPASKTNEVSFQFGKAKKTNFDFTGRVKGSRGAQCVGDEDETREGFRSTRGTESLGEFYVPHYSSHLRSCSLIRISAGNLSTARPSQTEVVEHSPSKATTGKEGRDASRHSVVETERTLQKSALPEFERARGKGGLEKPAFAQNSVFHEASSMTNYESQVNQDGNLKKITSPLEYLEKSVYFESLSNRRDKESDDTSNKLPGSKLVQDQQSLKHQNLPETEENMISSRSQPDQPDNPLSTKASMQYPKFNILANRLKKNGKSMHRGQKNERKAGTGTNREFASQCSMRVNKPKAIKTKGNYHNENSSQMSSLQMAIDDVVREAYAEELNEFTIEREHFVAQVAALKAINSNLNSDLNKANKLHHHSTEGLKRLKDKVSAKSEQIEELRSLTDEMKSDLVENKCAFREVIQSYDDTKKQLRSALSGQENFSEASKRTSNLISELKESVGQLITLDFTNKHLHEEVAEKNNRLTEEKERRSALDQQLQRIVLEQSNVAEINTLVMTLSQRLDEIRDNANNADNQSSSEDNLAACLQAIRSLQEQQKFHSGYVMHAGAELQNLSRR